MWYSWDEGKSCNEGMELPIPGLVPNRLKELKNGRWTIVSHRYNEKGFLEQMLYISDNKEKNGKGPLKLPQKKG